MRTVRVARCPAGCVVCLVVELEHAVGKRKLLGVAVSAAVAYGFVHNLRVSNLCLLIK